MRVFALAYCILFCPVWLSSLGGLLFSEEARKGDLGERRGGGRTRRSGRRETGWNVLYERRIYFQQKEKKSLTGSRKAKWLFSSSLLT